MTLRLFLDPNYVKIWNEIVHGQSLACFVGVTVLGDSEYFFFLISGFD